MTTTRPGSAWDTLLMIVISLVLVYGVAMVVAGLAIGDSFFDRLGFGPPSTAASDGEVRDYLQLVYGIIGAVIVGWMITLIAIAAGPLRRRERWSWWAIAGGSVTWFILDTGLSVSLGFTGHALFNVAFALALAVPLFAIRYHLNRSPDGRVRPG